MQPNYKNCKRKKIYLCVCVREGLSGWLCLRVCIRVKGNRQDLKKPQKSASIKQINKMEYKTSQEVERMGRKKYGISSREVERQAGQSVKKWAGGRGRSLER